MKIAKLSTVKHEQETAVNILLDGIDMIAMLPTDFVEEVGFYRQQELLSIKTSIINNCYNCILLFKEHHQQPNFRNVIAEQLNCLLVLYVLFLPDGFNLATKQSLVIEA